MSGRFASLHSGLLIRERPPAPPPCAASAPPQSAVVRPFPTVAPLRANPETRARASSRRSFTVRLDEAQHVLLQLAKLRFGLSGQRLLVLALERLIGAGGR